MRNHAVFATIVLCATEELSLAGM